MRKTYKSLIILLIMTVIVSLCGCSSGGGNSGSSTDKESVSDTNVFENGYYILADWENYEQCVQVIQNGYFGKVIQSTDHVTHGNQSARLEVWGYSCFWGYQRPSLRINTNGKYFQKNDFSDCDMIAFDMYSEMEYDIPLLFKMMTVAGSVYDTEKGVTRNLTIKPGWNYIEINRYDLGAEWRNEINYFSFIFDFGFNHEETQVVYIDNFRARKIAE